MIATAVQRGNQVYVYDVKGNVISTIDGLLESYTGDSVSVRKGKHIFISNAKGQNVRSIPI
jgi:hypothetical protein